MGHGDDPGSAGPQRVELVNSRQVARRVSRSLWWLWAVPLALAVIVGAVAFAGWYHSRRDDDRALQADLDQRASSAPQSGDGWEISRIRCTGGDTGTVSGQMKNTTDRPRSFSVGVRFIDDAGTLIGADNTSVPTLEPGQVANFRASSSLVTFPNGPALHRCLLSAIKTPDSSDFTLRPDSSDTSTSAPPIAITPG